MHLAKEPPHSVAYLEGELMPKAAALQLGMSMRPDGSACEDHLVIGAASGDVLICDLKRRLVVTGGGLSLHDLTCGYRATVPHTVGMCLGILCVCACPDELPAVGATER
jgi:hypothetical protein